MKNNKKIKFEMLFNVENQEKTKVKFNINDADPKKMALDYLLEDENKWKKMNMAKSKHINNNYANAEYVLSFAQYYKYGAQYYLFGGFYEIKNKNGKKYNIKLLERFKEYRKRVIIKLKNPVGQIYLRKYKNVVEKLDAEIYEISPTVKTIDFTGYNEINLKFHELKAIFDNNEPKWEKALKNVNGIYIIIDDKKGKFYIGSTYNQKGIWGRWGKYANEKNPTGNDKVLKSIYKNNKDYIKNNFRYSILEIFDLKISKDVILKRETYWKKVIGSRGQVIGMNKN